MLWKSEWRFLTTLEKIASFVVWWQLSSLVFSFNQDWRQHLQLNQKKKYVYVEKKYCKKTIKTKWFAKFLIWWFLVKTIFQSQNGVDSVLSRTLVETQRCWRRLSTFFFKISKLCWKSFAPAWFVLVHAFK